MNHPTKRINMAAYGGEGWSPRTASLRQELGRIWGPCGVSSEWAPLKAVLLHRPGDEIGASQKPNTVQMIKPLDVKRAQDQHDAIARAYEAHGVQVFNVDPTDRQHPNQMFVADLIFMTPEGAILARPASTVRAGEECQVARRLAELKIPILRSIRGTGTFEGADASWLTANSVIIGKGLRTNTDGANQVAAMLEETGVTVLQIDLPYGTMHLMGILRFAADDLAVAWPGRLAHAAVVALQQAGYTVIFLPDLSEAVNGFALNFVTLGPRHVLMPRGNPHTQKLLQQHGVVCETVAVDELVKAAGAIGCLTGILQREDSVSNE